LAIPAISAPIKSLLWCCSQGKSSAQQPLHGNARQGIERAERLVNILTADQIDIAERFTGKDGLKGADRFAGAHWTTRVSGVPLLVGALSAIDCEAEDIIERHSHAIVIGRVLDLQLSSRTAALAYWQGQYVAIDQNEDAVKLAEVSLPTPRNLREI
jgi:flavin reductase (DIM6/NTAB) family NADH-FMN oxidoreductase RutF